MEDLYRVADAMLKEFLLTDGKPTGGLSVGQHVRPLPQRREVYSAAAQLACLEGPGAVV
jgi:hypothetical protein